MIPILVRRNPITGEEIVVETENEGKSDCNNKEVKGKLRTSTYVIIFVWIFIHMGFFKIRQACVNGYLSGFLL